MTVTVAALHLHSTYSDGEMTLPELRDVLRADGCRLGLVTDHADMVAPSELAAYADECRRLSDADFRFVAGLEFPCEDRMHVLGYGVTAPTAETAPEAVFAHIEAHGGIAVIAHPKDDHFDWIESLEALPHGIETWNTKYDGRYAPRPETYDLLARLQRRRPDLRAFYGLDLHYRSQYRDLRCELDDGDVLPALAAGRFRARTGELTLTSDGRLPDDLRARFARARRRSGRVRRVAKRVAPHVPQAVKAPVRRWF